MKDNFLQELEIDDFVIFSDIMTHLYLGKIKDISKLGLITLKIFNENTIIQVLSESVYKIEKSVAFEHMLNCEIK